jgi:hypothetical protein
MSIDVSCANSSARASREADPTTGAAKVLDDIFQQHRHERFVFNEQNANSRERSFRTVRICHDVALRRRTSGKQQNAEQIKAPLRDESTRLRLRE